LTRFDSLGFQFSIEGPSVAEKTIEKFLERAVRHYEPEPGEAFAPSRFKKYVQRWIRWFYCGINGQMDDLSEGSLNPWRQMEFKNVQHPKRILQEEGMGNDEPGKFPL
jgi:hypothetical protein